MVPTPDDCTCAFGYGLILKLVDAFEKEIDGVRQNKDIEYVHRMRVASRRLRNVLTVFTACLPAKKSTRWQKQVRAITQSLGQVRDMDVQIEHITEISSQLEDAKLKRGINRLALRLRQQRENLQKNILDVLDTLVASGILEEIKDHAALAKQTDETQPFTAQLYKTSFHVINMRLDDLLSFRPYVHRPECKTELHAMRIAAKKLRYTLEIFTPLYGNHLEKHLPKVRRIQVTLGNLHDCDVWLQFMPQFITEECNRTIAFYGRSTPFNSILPGLLYLQTLEAQSHQDIYQDFVSDWEKWEVSGVWENLDEIIRAPVLPKLLYPHSAKGKRIEQPLPSSKTEI